MDELLVFSRVELDGILGGLSRRVKLLIFSPFSTKDKITFDTIYLKSIAGWLGVRSCYGATSSTSKTRVRIRLP